MERKVHPSQELALTSREIRELQKLHELGKKYLVSWKKVLSLQL